MEVDPDDVHGAEHEQHERDPAQDPAERVAGIADEDRDERGDRDADHHDPPPRGDDPAERVLARPVQDVLPVHEQ